MKDSSFNQNLSGVDFDENDDFEVSKIALPFEMPKALDMKSFPDAVKRSGAVETLIQQNDDLMSRLSVTLRRVADLEGQVQMHEATSAQFKTRYDNLKDQVLVLKQKAQILSSRNQNEEAEVNAYRAEILDLRQQLQVFELRYTELLETQQKKESRLVEQLSSANQKLSRLERFRARIKKIGFSLRKNRELLNTENQRLARRLEHTEATLEDLRNNFLDSAEYIKKQSQDHQIEVVAITQKFENELNSNFDQIARLQKQNDALNEKVQELDAAMMKATEMENALVLNERKFDDFRLQAATEQSDLQKSLGRYRNESKEFALELEATKAELNHSKSEMAAAREETFRLTEQVENLQTLWREQNVKTEKLTTQNLSLQKLNQELSMTINRYRKELRELRERADIMQIENSQSASLAATAAIASGTVMAPATPSEAEATANNTTPLILEKIDKVLAEMQINI